MSSAFILVVIMVSNSRFYDEEPIYAVEFPTQVACQAEAVKYPTQGIHFKKAVCVPKVITK